MIIHDIFFREIVPLLQTTTQIITSLRRLNPPLQNIPFDSYPISSKHLTNLNHTKCLTMTPFQVRPNISYALILWIIPANCKVPGAINAEDLMQVTIKIKVSQRWLISFALRRLSVFHSHAANLFFVLSSIHRFPQPMQNSSTWLFSENTLSKKTRPEHFSQCTYGTICLLIRDSNNTDSTSRNNQHLKPF